MRNFATTTLLLLLLTLCLGSTVGQVANPIESDTVPVEYMDGNFTLLGHVAMVENATEPVPAIVIIPDWFNVDTYEQVRATLVRNEWGFVGFAADIYGPDYQPADNATERRELATFYRSNPDVFASRIRAAVETVKAMESVDEDKVALFGYCFGGTGVLQYVLNGNEDVSAVVSFHGGLSGLPETPLEVGPKVLVLSGGADDTATEIMDLEMTMNQANATWEITRYSDILHAFTKWEDERYNEWADMRSWMSAGEFVLEAFDIVPYEDAKPDMITTVPVDYTDSMDGKNLTGHLAVPSDDWMLPAPAVLILPDWDGANAYEQERATALAELGYVAMVADIYGSDKQFVEEFSERAALVGQYLGNPELYVSRIQTAIEQLKMLDDTVVVSDIAIIGYCFGGSGAVLYSFSDGSEAKAAVAFHGSYSTLPPVNVTAILPYVHILSGGADVLHGNQTTMEAAFNSGDANWEITRYSGAGHGFTDFDGAAYDLTADARSWTSMLAVLEELMTVPELADPNASMAPSPAATSSNSSSSMAPTVMMPSSGAPTMMPQADIVAPTMMPTMSGAGGTITLNIVAAAVGAVVTVLCLL